ncbi:hypothetical protein Gxy13693_045_037 [Komagataeibacter xylinus NBRC 13693]|uniref:Uncharacterized protein n=1 Tax=Komagataeibacter xylinus NBRC 13693 TaxID=1234668 RepID=A0A0D6Q9X2_KOMXY|nr:hypothetical protein [Komagataeibacter xylinus]GAO00313.1 hypothetical protein Gxy13693_045_037 [Komagataeibacter xylinus NBRC 13693]
MRNAMVLSLLVGLTGCGGFGHILSGNTELPGSLPNTPHAEVENMRRVAGQAPQVLPIMPQERNIWPVVRSGQSVLVAIGADGVSAGARSQLVEREVDLPAGGEMRIGNDADPDGVPAGGGHVSALSSGPLATHKGVSDSAIVVPNGDGTTTVVASDGTVQEQQAP